MGDVRGVRTVFLGIALAATGCGTPAIDAMKVKALELPGEGSFCVRHARMLPIRALMDDGTKRTIDPKADRDLRFDPAVLEWTSTIGRVNVVKTGVLSVSPDYAEYVPPENEMSVVETNVKITISMKGNPFLKNEIELSPDFACPISADASGSSGSPGSSGNSGSGDGAAGGSGGPGGRGNDASPVEVFLAPFETDKRGTLIQVRMDGAGGSASYLLSPSGRISLSARGGNGGNGGSGGQGGPGANKTGGCGDGGAGGPGGSGGAGGPGGSGGAVLVHVDEEHADWARLIDIDNGPGSGGEGGPGGQGGNGGSPGTQPDGPQQGQTCGSTGAQGGSGSAGPSGPGGSGGPPAQVRTERLTAGSTPAKHEVDHMTPPTEAELAQAKLGEAFWGAHKGPNLVKLTNGTNVMVCSVMTGPQGKNDKSTPANLLTSPLRPGETREIGHVGGQGSIPLTVTTCDKAKTGSFALHLDRETAASFQPPGKAPKAGTGAAVFLQAAP